MKKKILIIIACMLTVTLVTSAKTEENEQEIKLKTLEYLHVLDGYGNGEYKLNQLVTRAEMSKMVYILARGTSDLGKPFLNSETGYNDLDKNGNSHWAKGYISYCTKEGYIKSKSSLQFKPEDHMTIKEVCSILLRCMGVNEGKQLTEERDKMLNSCGKDEFQKATREDVINIIYDSIPQNNNKNKEEYPLAIVTESKYDPKTKEAEVTLVYLKSEESTAFSDTLREKCIVSDFYTAEPERKDSCWNEEAEDFADNHKFGYLYRIEKKGEKVDLSIIRGIAPKYTEKVTLVGLPKYYPPLFTLGNQLFFPKEKTKFFSVYPNLSTACMDAIIIDNIYRSGFIKLEGRPSDVLVDQTEMDMPFGSIYAELVNGEEKIHAFTFGIYKG